MRCAGLAPEQGQHAKIRRGLDEKRNHVADSLIHDPW
jgi:hypothetical protein